MVKRNQPLDPITVNTDPDAKSIEQLDPSLDEYDRHVLNHFKALETRMSQDRRKLISFRMPLSKLNNSPLQSLTNLTSRADNYKQTDLPKVQTDRK